MTAPRASLLRRLLWWLRGGPARRAARAARRMGFPPAHAAIVGWCEWATHTIALAPLMTGISLVTGFLLTSGPRGRVMLATVLLLLVAPPFALHLVTTPRGALLLGVPLAFVAGLGLVVIAATLQGRTRRP